MADRPGQMLPAVDGRCRRRLTLARAGDTSHVVCSLDIGAVLAGLGARAAAARVERGLRVEALTKGGVSLGISGKSLMMRAIRDSELTLQPPWDRGQASMPLAQILYEAGAAWKTMSEGWKAIMSRERRRRRRW